ncbi:MAG: hypothetical protein ACRDIB_09260, partial [Ardenticatenaceae bacterium]
MARRESDVKRLTRAEAPEAGSWWSRPANLLLVLVLSVFTFAAIYIATQLLGPADEQAEALRQEEGDVAAAGPCELAGEQVLTGELPEPTSTAPSGPGEGKPQWSEPFPMVIDPDCDYRATIESSKGAIEVDLFEEEAPNT